MCRLSAVHKECNLILKWRYLLLLDKPEGFIDFFSLLILLGKE